MKSVLIALKQHKASAGSAEYGAVSYILNHPEESSKCSIYRLAELSYASASTIVRLCRKLGFSGYREMQSTLIRELAVRAHSIKKHARQTDRFDSMQETISSITYRNIALLEASAQLLDEAALEKSIKILNSCKSLYLFGMGSSLSVAQDALLKFIRIGKPCICCTDIHSQYAVSSNTNMTDAAIVISCSGCTEEILHCAANLSSQGTPIIAITHYDDTPLSSLASCTLHSAYPEDLFCRGAIPTCISQFNVVDILCTAYMNKSYSESFVKNDTGQISKTGI